MASLLDPPPFSSSLLSNTRTSQLASAQQYSSPTIYVKPIGSHSKKASAVCSAGGGGEAVDPSPSQNPNLALERTKDRQKVVRVAWEKLVRWSRSWRSKAKTDVLERTNKVVVLGGGSFGTAMAAHVAGRKAQLEVSMLVRDPRVCESINERHYNFKYFPESILPENVVATTDAETALRGADFCLHAVPVQFSSLFLEGIVDYVDPGLPFISLSKGLELNTLRTMSQIIPQALRNPRQPYIVLSGPSFASELMNNLPTVASKDKKLANAVQQLLASRNLRINRSSDVTGVEIAGALKNVLAIAAGIVEGMNLGNNSMAALVAQGCSEIRWLATKMGAKSTTITGLSGTGDIMLTCFVDLSRNRTVGVRLGSGEKLDDILTSMNQVAEGVFTAGAVIALAQKYNVKMPVLTAVARIIDNELTPQKAVLELMSLPQYSEALISYTEEPHFPLNATKFTFPPLLKACATLSNLYYGKTLHATINTLGLRYDPYVISSLINMYVKCGSFISAVQLFDDMSERDGLARDVTVWNSMIDGYFKYGLIYEGALQFCRMQVSGVKPDGYTLSILIGECRKLLGYLEGKQFHAYVVRNMFDDDPFVVTALIDMYASCGRPIQGWHVFEMSGDKDNVVAWNAIISGFCENGLWENSLVLYMLAKNESCILGSATFSSTLTACSRGEDLGCGMQIHCDVMKLGFEGDPYVGTSLLTMYAKGGLVEDAEKVFDAKLNKKVEIWNAMISAYGGKGCASDALNVYLQMKVEAVSSDCFTIRNLLASCSRLGLYGFGRALHGEVIKRPMQGDVTVQSALLTMYSKCGRMEDASAVFSTMKERDIVAWGSLISGFCQNRKFREALYLFKVMEADGEKPDSDIMVSVTIASTGLENAGLSQGVHGFVIKNGLEWDAFVGSSLIDMYSHYRCPIMARDVSLDIPHKNLVVWNSLISCYSQNGLPELSIGLLPQITHNGLMLQNFHDLGSVIGSSKQLQRQPVEEKGQLDRQRLPK
ncbi:hypothetical protein RJ639_047372 [Escallonia herrerae]|uniref:Glycerol-3-phosphate dehydrogenase [NAD(+)] n=1 Tax=Escallonia herrerae TaxID=1293975 RepID=A0AA88W9K6_9ASTE|nr:hypothetical protein RJ639_047372 [Escallonia herrerae]